MQRLHAPSGALRTGGLLHLVSRLGQVSLPFQTLARWAADGILAPSGRATSDFAKRQWTAADVVLVLWLVRLRDGGWSPQHFRRRGRTLWTRLTRGLSRPGQRYLVLLDGDAAVVMSGVELQRAVRARADVITTSWPAVSLDRVRREAARMDIRGLR